MNLNNTLKSTYGKGIEGCTDTQLLAVLQREANRLAMQKERPAPKKKLYYLCAEFLIGRLLADTLCDLGIYSEIEAELAQHGRSLSALLSQEPEPSLGNGGLGRLAACFLDSIAALGLPGDGVGLCYHFGLFRQYFEKNAQCTKPDAWLSELSGLVRTDVTFPVKFGDTEVLARMYDLLISGKDCTNRLHLFDLESVDESLVGEGIRFDKTAVSKNLTLFLYPDDSDEDGKRLRIFQQYFMVSCAAQLILREVQEKGCKLYDLPDFAVIQLNDTHPTMVIPELIRLLMERGLPMDAAIDAVSACCAYTNHTILAEALEKWNISDLKRTVPQLVPIIEALDSRIRRRFEDSSVYLIDRQERVHMAHLAIHFSFSVNGVAALHTKILKESELHPFYRLYPERFNNKTNGITFRRWLLQCNPQLSKLISSLIGDGYRENPQELQKLLQFRKDAGVLHRLLEIKSQKKAELAAYFQEQQGISLSEDSIFDIQIKRLHEYKRQQLNALFLIAKYLEIKSGKLPKTPITAIFGGKAAPAYTTAKDIIHLILCLQELTLQDPQVREHLQIVMAENYNVTWAEKLIPSCDISEQISLASKEASGTGNMKFMLNGALTLGTQDGANVEIHELVGDENIYMFGDASDTVVKRYARGSYNPQDYLKADPVLCRAVEFIIGKKLLGLGDETRLQRLYMELTTMDYFMTFPDFKDYVRTRERAYADYENRMEWAEKMLVNIAMAGYFSSDRTISEYNRDIWRLTEAKHKGGTMHG